eukprot:10405068-Prorocentrum_lima.AAC.1
MTSSLVGSEMCIRDSGTGGRRAGEGGAAAEEAAPVHASWLAAAMFTSSSCLLYTSDAADDM